MKEMVLPEYIIDLGGISVRLIYSVIREECEECGEGTVEIPDLEGLTKATALTRALLPIRMSGDDVKFTRLALEMNGREFAEAMELSPETVSRWENNERGIGGYTEKLLRHNICALLHTQVKGVAYDPAEITKMRVKDTPEGFVLPPIPFRRVPVMVKEQSVPEETWYREAA